MLEDIARLHADGRLEEAESAYRVLLAEDANNVDALHLLGALRRERADHAEARMLLERARILSPDRCDVLMELAGLHFLDGDNVGARSLLERVVKLDPNLPGAYTLLARIAELQGDAGSAQSLYRTALRLSETDAIALGGLGRVLLDADQADKALGNLTRAAELAPKDAQIQTDLARAFAMSGNMAFAEQAANNALALRPELHAARRVLGQVLLQQGRLDEATAAFAVLSEAPAHRAFALFGLADAARLSGKLDDAVPRYREALALQPDLHAAVQMLGFSLSALGRDDEAVALYTTHLATHPDALPIQAALADQHLQAGRFALSMEIWKSIAQRRPNDPVPVQRLAVLCEFAGDNDNAAMLAERVAPALTRDPELALLRVRAALRAGRNTDASALLDSVRGMDLTPPLVMQAAQLFGVLADRTAQPALAVPAWLEAQSGLPALVHALPNVDAALQQRLADVPGAVLAPAPVFLVGLPGSMVERVAALLQQQPGVNVLRDRAFSPQRDDDFVTPQFERYLSGLDSADALARRQRWSDELARSGADPNGRNVDWIARWDARFLPLLQQAFAGATVVVVRRDPRDLLLNWLAYGWMPGFALEKLDVAANWLVSAQAHLAAIEQARGLNIVNVDADALLADPLQNGADLAKALGLPQLLPGAPQLARGGLIPGLPAGRWQAYAEVLSVPFSIVERGTLAT